MHLASACPHNVYLNQSDREKESKDDKEKEAHCMDVLSTSTAGSTLAESFNHGVLDSACSSTVCGIDWYDTFLKAAGNHIFMCHQFSSHWSWIM